MRLSPDEAWLDFAQRLELTDKQLSQFQMYYQLLVKTNELFNLTTITEVTTCIAYHFEDSLIARNFVPLQEMKCIADIGAGAGFPGLPLKIFYPHLKLILIEVSHKKVQFLTELCSALELENVELVTFDWRTFLRKTNETVDLFCARASLHPVELVRMFKPSSPYKGAQLMYWASDTWQPEEDEVRFIKAEYFYKIRHKKRKLILFSASLSPEPG